MPSHKFRLPDRFRKRAPDADRTGPARRSQKRRNGPVKRSVPRNEGWLTFPDAELALDDGCCAISLVRSGLPTEVQKRVSLVIHGNTMVSHAEVAAGDLQRRLRSGCQNSAQRR